MQQTAQTWKNKWFEILGVVLGKFKKKKKACAFLSVDLQAPYKGFEDSLSAFHR